jgi:hypothetical protein
MYPVGSEVHLGANGPAVTVLYTIQYQICSSHTKLTAVSAEHA